MARKRSIAGVDQNDLVEPQQLGESDSSFCDFNGVRIHHKICGRQDVCENAEPKEEEQTLAIGLPMILMHGFGGAVFTWNAVMSPLARLVGSRVLAFDRPAFGLTAKTDYSSPSKLNVYSTAFSVFSALSFMDMLGGSKAIIMGHSAGSLVAVETYFEAPERVGALILVAPAIVAPLVLPTRNNGVQRKEETGNSVYRKNSLMIRIWMAFVRLFASVVRMALIILKHMYKLAMPLYTRALSAFFRSSVAVILLRVMFDNFSIPVIRSAWFNTTKATDRSVEGYTKILKIKGWEVALLEYLLALLTDSASKPTLWTRLAHISCPVLIITGDTDRLVPAWNSRRLSHVIPGCSFEVIRNCGHIPHEEKADEFVSVVERFLRKTFVDNLKHPNDH